MDNREALMRIVRIAEAKRLVIIRGCPGSGKSTLAGQLGKGGVVLSTDDFFMVNGEYLYDKEMIGQAHLWNQSRTRQAMQRGVSPVVIDNTNITWEECAPYAKLAAAHGYEVSYAEPETPWKSDAEELTRRNRHGVPREVIQNMLDRWQPTDTLGVDKTASAAIDARGFAQTGRLTDDERELFALLLKVVQEKKLGTTVRVAGGWVRDKLMDKQPKDLDLMVDNIGGSEFARAVTSAIGLSDPHVIRANPEQSKNIETARMYIPLKSGTKMEIDVARARQDAYESGTRIPVTTHATPEEDAFRRDLTINCLFYNVNEDVVEDFTGKGLDDLRDRVIRTPLDPVKTFSDDPLRMLRTVRFAARYGWGIAPETRQALASPDLRAKLRTKVSRERKGIELKGMLSAGYPEEAISLLLDTGLFEDLLGDALAGSDRAGRMSPVGMDQDNPHHELNWAEHTKALARGMARKYRGKEPDKVFKVMMAALLHDVGKLDSASRQQKDGHTSYHGHEDISSEVARTFMQFVKLEPDMPAVEALVRSHMRPHHLTRHDSNKQALRRFIRQMSELGIDWDDVVSLAAADAMAKGGKVTPGTAEGYDRLLAEGKEAAEGMKAKPGSGVKPVLNGQEIMDAFGLKPGPEVGKMLKTVIEMMDADPAITKEEALRRLGEIQGRNWLDRGMEQEAGKARSPAV